MSEFFGKSGGERDVVVSSRVRFARNLKGLPFPWRMDEKAAEEVLDRVENALNAAPLNFTRRDFHKMNPTERGAMAERHLVSRELVAGKLPRGVFLSPDEGVAIMVNEEDHLRIQLIGAGLCLTDCLDEAKRIDALLDEALHFAFDEKLGYLTACPTNLGCGLRVSVMLHLPALTATGGIREIISAAAKMGLTVRGMYGEGTTAGGAMYQISNALSLGVTEAEIAERLETAVRGIIDSERGLRAKIFKENPAYIENRVYRALALLKSARVMSSEEALSLISDARLGAGIIDGADADVLDRLLWEIGRDNVSARSGASTSEGRARERAEMLRKEMA
jgi:protein arginine kinase